MKSKGKQNEEAKETIPNMSCRTEYARTEVQKWNNHHQENISEHVLCHFTSFSDMIIWMKLKYQVIKIMDV